MLKDKFVIGVSSLVAITIVVGAFLSSSRTIATSTSAQATVNVAEACTMSSTLTTPHSATIPNGTYQENIGITTLKVTCNDSQGYAIYAVGYTGDEIGGTNSTKLVVTSSNIDTGTATSGNTSNWAMKISTSGSSFVGTIDNSFGNYHAVPSEYTKVAHFNSSTDAGPSANGSTYQTTYAAFVSSTQLAGNYTGKVKYTMVHPANETPAQPIACEAKKICYNPNTNIVVGQMGKQSASNNASTILWASNFKRDGYGFVGWNDKFDYSGTNYGPNQTITAPSDVQTKGLSLYAVWIKSAGTIQNWNGCSSLSQGATTALTDSRDGNVYAVAKLADNKCWMIENLRLADKDSNNNDIILSNDNTHNPSLPLTNTWWYSSVNDSDMKPTSNHLSDTTDPTNIAWCQTNSSNCDDQSMIATNNTTLFANNTSSSYSTSSNIYSYGNYYNWYSATAGHGKYGYNGSSYTSPGDICPAGWHLPTGKDATGEFGILDIALGGTGVESDSSTTPTASTMSLVYRSYPNNFIYSGSINYKSIFNRNSHGYYMSASEYDYQSSQAMVFGSNLVRPGTSFNNKYIGRTIRCISSV